MIDDPGSVAAIESAFASQRVYMADGHHCYESARASQDDRPGSRRVLMGIVCATDPALAVGATHRVVHAAAPPRLPERLSASFVVREIEKDDLDDALPDGSAMLALVTIEGASILEPMEAAREALPPSVPSMWQKFPSALLQHGVLEPTFGIDAQTLAGGDAVTYTHHLQEA